MATVDVIIPYHNTPRPFIHAAVESVLTQTFRDFHCIIVNDGSSADYTIELEELLADFDDARLIYVHQPNGGAASARNAGMKASHSPYIALLDSDDLWYPGRLALHVRFLEDHPHIALVHGRLDVLKHDGQCVHLKPQDFVNQLDQTAQLARMLRENVVNVGTTMFRRTCAEAIGGFDESFLNIEDKEFFLRLLFKGYHFWYLADIVALYRMHVNNKSSNVERMLLARRRLIQKVDDLIRFRPDLQTLHWATLKQAMLTHALQEAAEQCLARRDYRATLHYIFQSRWHVSLPLIRLFLAATFNALARGTFSHVRS